MWGVKVKGSQKNKDIHKPKTTYLGTVSTYLLSNKYLVSV